VHNGGVRKGGQPGPPAAGGRALAPRLQLLAAAALFSTGGAAIKSVHFAGWPVACLRSGIAAVALLLVMQQTRRRPTWRVLGVAACYAATMILYVLANKLTTAASTIFLQSTAPLFVLLLSPWLLGERIRRSDLLSMAAIALGLALLVAGLEPASATAPQPLRGNVLAALSGLTWALTIMGLRGLGRVGAGAGRGGARADGAASGGHARRRMSRVDIRYFAAGSPCKLAAEAGVAEGTWWPEAEVVAAQAETASRGDAVAAAFWGNVLACAASLPWSLPLPPSVAGDWAVLAFLGLFQIGFAYILLTRGIGRVPALEASLLLMLEPVLNPLWAWLVHGERPGPRVFAGGALILAATLLNSWHDARLAARERAAPAPRPAAAREI
jgi:drug/metabolite transporter (DMT)-like permease